MQCILKMTGHAFLWDFEGCFKGRSLWWCCAREIRPKGAKIQTNKVSSRAWKINMKRAAAMPFLTAFICYEIRVRHRHIRKKSNFLSFFD